MSRPRVAARLIGRWRSLPPRTIRLRLTAIYAGLFLVCAAALLAINYGLVSERLTSTYFERVSVSAGKQQLLFSQNGGSISGSAGGVSVGVLSGGPVQNPFASSRSYGGGLPPDLEPVVRAAAVASSNGALGTLLLESGVALAIMALLAAGLGWVMAGRALRPLRTITAAAQEISASNLHRRLALGGPDDELRQLGRTFDALLERLESAFTAQRQFAANVSHELRTPLTYERTLIEVALADPAASSGRLRAVLDQLLVAGEHQERLIEALLVLSRGQRGLDHAQPLDLATIAAEAVDAVEAGELTISCSLAPAPTDGDARLIERLVANLLANAVQYNEPAGAVEVATWTSGRQANLRISNTGPTVAPADLDRLFEPFQRADGARASTASGLGLGLSIVRAIADAHGATIAAGARDGGGLSIDVAFPAARGGRRETRPARELEPATAASGGRPAAR